MLADVFAKHKAAQLTVRKFSAKADAQAQQQPPRVYYRLAVTPAPAGFAAAPVKQTLAVKKDGNAIKLAMATIGGLQTSGGAVQLAAVGAFASASLVEVRPGCVRACVEGVCTCLDAPRKGPEVEQLTARDGEGGGLLGAAPAVHRTPACGRSRWSTRRGVIAATAPWQKGEEGSNRPAAAARPLLRCCAQAVQRASVRARTDLQQQLVVTSVALEEKPSVKDADPARGPVKAVVVTLQLVPAPPPPPASA